MEFFLDTAEIRAIETWDELGLVDGITTNPALLAKSGQAPKEQLGKIAKMLGQRPVSAQVTVEGAERMIKQAHQLRELGENIVIKLPCTPDGLKALCSLSKDGFKTNITLAFDPTAAAVFAKNGATYVSIFVGRTDDYNLSQHDVIARTRAIYDNMGTKTKILAASFRNPLQLEAAMMGGADTLTVPPATWDLMFKNPLTRIGAQDFKAAWDKIDSGLRNSYEQ